MNPFLRSLDERVLVFDGAMGTELMALELIAEDSAARLPRLQRSARAVPARLISGDPRRYFEAGADVLETDTFTASRLKLDEYGLGDRVAEVNVRAARLAREARPTVSRRRSGRASSPARWARPAC